MKGKLVVINTTVDSLYNNGNGRICPFCGREFDIQDCGLRIGAANIHDTQFTVVQECKFSPKLLPQFEPTPGTTATFNTGGRIITDPDSSFNFDIPVVQSEETNKSHKCSCDMRILMMKGCQCGGI